MSTPRNVDDDEDVLYGSMDMSVPGVLEPSQSTVSPRFIHDVLGH